MLVQVLGLGIRLGTIVVTVGTILGIMVRGIALGIAGTIHIIMDGTILGIMDHGAGAGHTTAITATMHGIRLITIMVTHIIMVVAVAEAITTAAQVMPEPSILLVAQAIVAPIATLLPTAVRV